MIPVGVDPRTIAVLKALDEVYPAFAKKLLQGNDLMRILVGCTINPMDILDYPVCGRCETLAVHDVSKQSANGSLIEVCRCVKDGCGATTTNPVTVREWLQYELKKRVDKSFFDVVEYMTDAVAMTMMHKLGNVFASMKRPISGGELSDGIPSDD